MSRSRKKTKIHGFTTATSEKIDKQNANRRFRRIVNEKIKSQLVDFPKVKEVSNVWEFAKDGKTYNPNLTEKEMRK